MGDMETNLYDCTNVPNAQFISQPISSPEITNESIEISPRLLNLICKDQFGSRAGEDASVHIHDFCEICDMQNYKNIDNSIDKLKKFPFSLRGKAKEWLLSLPNGIINYWDNLKDSFIKRYQPSVSDSSE
jgi:hypothetical protein